MATAHAASMDRVCRVRESVSAANDAFRTASEAVNAAIKSAMDT